MDGYKEIANDQDGFHSSPTKVANTIPSANDGAAIRIAECISVANPHMIMASATARNDRGMRRT